MDAPPYLCVDPNERLSSHGCERAGAWAVRPMPRQRSTGVNRTNQESPWTPTPKIGGPVKRIHSLLRLARRHPYRLSVGAALAFTVAFGALIIAAWRVHASDPWLLLAAAVGFAVSWPVVAYFHDKRLRDRRIVARHRHEESLARRWAADLAYLRRVRVANEPTMVLPRYVRDHIDPMEDPVRRAYMIDYELPTSDIRI